MSKIFNPEEWGVSKQDKKAIELIVELEKTRKDLNLTQKEVAERARITQGQLSRIENLESIPSLETINNIAEALDKKLTLV
ncbi:helix-turn-helix domain-containing protein [Salinicoccus halodurans]|uniref:Helix-turn-helix n=1 Tax=Salinicoccus halodurans TaxID=407035 RepID=A0A0F7HIZ8_9STAP|nr:helix-turn-helix transcriptional regulator [Salinicoccus halodurans]AKG73514.1 hypothetical protein AAT16_04370 [Salinicoccus halodurans]SFK51881.1 Helix-turn-helix [Salinicoccus halodurans]